MKQYLQNKHRIEGDIIFISLTRDQETIIDITDLERALKYRWYATFNIMNGFYVATRIDNKTTYLHRYLLNVSKGKYVDHINHNTLDNRRENLRICTNQENCINRNGSYKTSKVGIRGVSVHQTNNKNKLKLYVFRCHGTTCKTSKYFTYNEEGLKSATILSREHYKMNENPIISYNQTLRQLSRNKD